MAKVIQTILNLRDNMSKGLLAAARNTQGVTREMRTATREVVNFKNKVSKSVTDAAKKLGTLSVAAVGAFAAFSVKAGMDFESQMSKVEALVTAGSDDIKVNAANMQKLTDAAKKMGATTKFSATESAQALEYMAMAGWKTDQMVSGLPGIINLSAASGEELGEVSDIVTDALTAFGLKASDATHFADVLAKASSSSNTNVGLMGETFKYAAPVAGALGYSIEDTAVAVGLMANAGIKGEQAGTALRGVLTNLAKPSDQVAGYMDALGVSLTDTAGNIKPLSTLMTDLRSKFAGLTEAQKAEYAAGIAGKNALSGFLAIINASDTDFNNLTAAIAQSDGTAQKMADTMNNNLAGQLTLLKSAAEGVGITFYDAIKGRATDAVTSLANKLSEWQADGTIDALATQVGNTFSTALDTASAALDWLSQNSDTVKNGLIGLAIAFSVVKVLKFAGDIAKAANDLGLFIQTVGAISAPLRAHAAAVLASGAAWVKNTAAMAANKIAMGASAIATGAMTAATNIATTAQWALNTAFYATPIGWIVAGIAAIIAAGVLLYQNWDTVKAYALDLWEKIKEVFAGIKSAIVGAFDAARSKVAGFFSWLDAKISSIPILGSIYGKGKEVVGGVAGWIGDKIAGNATGTSYWRGGLTMVNERGGELMNLPGGTQIIPHDVSMRAADSYGAALASASSAPVPAMAGGAPTFNLAINVNGNMIGNEQAANQFGEIIVGKVMDALRNL